MIISAPKQGFIVFIATFRVDILENGDKIIKHSLWLFNLNRFSKKKRERDQMIYTWLKLWQVWVEKVKKCITYSYGNTKTCKNFITFLWVKYLTADSMLHGLPVGIMVYLGTVHIVQVSEWSTAVKH